ncbi:MAG: hydantoinase/oxoprolinase family protein [Streptosporangiales bacterium]|nr:hydantoinase/oxoprolinase family protein [Streptosporangiales bacterium]
MVGIDVGGTFTDCISYENGQIKALKVPSKKVDPEQAVVEGASALGLDSVTYFNHASTVGLNAVITRNLPKIGYLTTDGHRDVPDMGRALRPFEALTDPSWRRSFGDANRPLVPRYLRRGVKERIKADGSVLIPLDRDDARRQLGVLKKCNVQGVAICLINAYVSPEHEIQLRELVREVLGDDMPCSISSEVSPLAKEYARASTTIVDVLMKGIFRRYADNLVQGLQERNFQGVVNFADCAATLLPIDFALERPYRVIFSGPAAGTVSTSYFGSLIGENNFICADVGGTSTDISVVTDGSPIVNTTFEVEHDLLVNTLANEISSLGAGGGSLVSVAPGGALQVGPESAGADPGPACYGRGGTKPTMTDVCLLAGLLNEEEFLGGEMRLDRSKARAAFESLDTPLSLDERVHHAYRLGLHNISEGITDIAIRYGIDPRDFSIMAYGSAGPMLLPAVLELTGVKSVVVPPYPGLFSALGLVSADRVYTDNRSAYTVLTPDAAAQVNDIYTSLEESLLERINARRDEVTILRTFDGRLVGQTWDTPFVTVPNGEISVGGIETMIGNFHRAYKERWGNQFEAMPVEGVTYRVQVIAPIQKVTYQPVPKATGTKPEPTGRVVLRYLESGEAEANEYARENLRSGDVVDGPAIIREAMATIQVCVGQQATVGDLGEIVIRRSGTSL